jgi:hypothetical protein
MPRHRSGFPALLVTGAYVVAVAVAAVVAMTAGDLGVLWRLTLFGEVDEDVLVTGPNVLILVLAGLPWAWALWQLLRGPLAGPPPELDRDTRRLRVALYAAAASLLLFPLMAAWSWVPAVLHAAVMWVVVLLFQPVLGAGLEFAGLARVAGVLGFGGVAVVDVFDVLDVPMPGGVSLICALAGLVWMVLVLRAQRHDDRWRPATAWYGIAAMVAPFVLMLMTVLMTVLLAAVVDVYEGVAVAGNALMLIWVARSAHDLADPRPSAAELPVGGRSG